MNQCASFVCGLMCKAENTFISSVSEAIASGFQERFGATFMCYIKEKLKGSSHDSS